MSTSISFHKQNENRYISTDGAYLDFFNQTKKFETIEAIKQSSSYQDSITLLVFMAYHNKASEPSSDILTIGSLIQHGKSVSGIASHAFFAGHLKENNIEYRNFKEFTENSKENPSLIIKASSHLYQHMNIVFDLPKYVQPIDDQLENDLRPTFSALISNIYKNQTSIEKGYGEYKDAKKEYLTLKQTEKKGRKDIHENILRNLAILHEPNYDENKKSEAIRETIENIKSLIGKSSSPFKKDLENYKKQIDLLNGLKKTQKETSPGAPITRETIQKIRERVKKFQETFPGNTYEYNTIIDLTSTDKAVQQNALAIFSNTNFLNNLYKSLSCPITLFPEVFDEFDLAYQAKLDGILPFEANGHACPYLGKSLAEVKSLDRLLSPVIKIKFQGEDFLEEMED